MSHITTKTATSEPVKEAKQQPSSPPVDNPYWRQELEELDRYFPRPTPDEAQRWADEELRKHDAIINKIETQLAQLKQLKEEPYPTREQKQKIADKIESVEDDLERAKRLRQQSINICGAGIRSSREWEPKRARWVELTRRKRQLDGLTTSIAKEFRF